MYSIGDDVIFNGGSPCFWCSFPLRFTHKSKQPPPATQSNPMYTLYYYLPPLKQRDVLVTNDSISQFIYAGGKPTNRPLLVLEWKTRFSFKAAISIFNTYQRSIPEGKPFIRRSEKLNKSFSEMKSVFNWGARDLSQEKHFKRGKLQLTQ